MSGAQARSSVVKAKMSPTKPIEEQDDYFLSVIKQKGFCHVSLQTFD